MIEKLLIYIFAINLITAGIYYFDKKKAQFGSWRIKEKTLLGLSFIGGTPAAYWAINKFCHKSKKSSFKSKLFIIALLQFFAILYIIFDKIILGN